MINQTMNRAKFKALKKMFNRKMDKIEEMAYNEQYDKFENHIVQAVAEGESVAEDIIENPEQFDDEVVQNCLEKINIDGINHSETKQFIQELKDMERNKDNYVHFAGRFRDYYLKQLRNKVNM